MTWRVNKRYAVQYGVGFARASPVFASCGLASVGEIGDGDETLRELIFANETRSLEVRWVIDHFVEITVVIVSSDVADEVHEAGDCLCQGIELFDILELAQISRQPDMVSWSFATRGLAAISTNYNGIAAEAIERGLADAREDARRIALLAISRVAWIEFGKVLRERIPTETNEAIRDEMTVLADWLEKHGKRPTGYIDW